MTARGSAFVFLAILCARASAQSPEAILQERLRSSVKSYAISGDNLLEALAKVSDDFHLRVGIEWVSPSVPSPVSFRYDRTTVLEILQDIVATDPAYTLGTANGVVHVAHRAVSDEARNFLSQRVGDFEASSEYVFHASNRLHGIVVGMTAYAGTQPQGRGCAGSFGIGAGDHLASFHLQNATVREILDAFLASSGFNIWLVTFPEVNTSAHGFFRTTSVFSPNLHDAELPTWDLLLPGYDPVRGGFGVGWQRGDWQPLTARPAR
jgi:hypothetical protein